MTPTPKSMKEAKEVVKTFLRALSNGSPDTEKIIALALDQREERVWERARLEPASEGRDKKTGGKFLNSGFAAGYDAGWNAARAALLKAKEGKDV